jgi:hypothetical protein
MTSNNEMLAFPALAANYETNMHTPERDTTRRPAGVTQAQKQALIDNLQLERASPLPVCARATTTDAS